MKRNLVLAAIGVLGYLYGYTGNHVEITFTEKEKAAFLNEADDFIDDMPDGFQDHQADAVLHGIQGNGMELAKLRESRNRPYEIADDIDEKELVGDGSARGLKMRLYSSNDPDGKMPLLVYLHGGGWVMGSLNSCAAFCEGMARKGVAVLAVDYSLSPENEPPKAMLDCIGALEYANAHAEEWGVNPNAISIGGDSAGGNLAIASCLYLNDSADKGAVPRSVVAFYPVVKCYRDDSKSWKRYSKGYGLDGRLMEAFCNAYVKDGNGTKYESPALASDGDLSKLPDMLIVGADRDILSDQGSGFAERVIKCGGKAQRIVLPGTVHLFITVDGQPSARAKSIEIASEYLLNKK